ncbi:MAG: hypothetical protein CMF62_11985 [Magnetococcales bacterium]|nr:hypothetical protein [Magnetococcales bacterium]|tara:strand:+ start:229110 stop:229583 length:474 start_codon:yes stop_codon:yes gene_type:complete
MTAFDTKELVTTSERNTLRYNTGFGEVALRDDRLLSFPSGLLGLPICTVFGLSRMPQSDESPLLLLQSVNDPSITFLSADPSVLGLRYSDEDRKKAIKEVGFNPKDTQMLVILTLYQDGEAGYLTANMRAPILIDSAQRVGRQHVLSNKDYSTQQKI